MTSLTIEPEFLLEAYACGLFPMAEDRDDPAIHWIEPKHRGIIPLDKFHIPKRLRRTLRNNSHQISVDKKFCEVIRACSESSQSRENTWINKPIENLYITLFNMGYAHSVETYKDGKLVGGLYGVALGGVFFGESMFSRTSDSSKLALCHLSARLLKSKFKLFDVQFITNHLKQFGAVEITQNDYKILLFNAVNNKIVFQSNLSFIELNEFIQSTTQIS
jgi:leucyl/phenylalanyl-tRNA--protein transferase